MIIETIFRPVDSRSLLKEKGLTDEGNIQTRFNSIDSRHRWAIPLPTSHTAIKTRRIWSAKGQDNIDDADQRETTPRSPLLGFAPRCGNFVVYTEVCIKSPEH